MKHKLKISVSNCGSGNDIVACKSITLREKILTKLLGPKHKLMILIPGNTVESIDISEVPKEGEAYAT